MSKDLDRICGNAYSLIAGAESQLDWAPVPIVNTEMHFHSMNVISLQKLYL